jgi:hypothetical protein
MADEDQIDLFYFDETQVSQQGYCPYGWQYPDEDVFIPSMKGGAKINLLGLWSRKQRFISSITEDNVNSETVISVLDDLSWQLKELTVVILDNASPHRSKKFRQMILPWQERGLYLFYLPPYSPQLNPIEWLWKQIKQTYLRPCDYADADSLRYRLTLIAATIGGDIRFKVFE